MAENPVKQVQQTWSTRPKTRGMGCLLQGAEEGDTNGGNPCMTNSSPWFIDFTDGRTRIMQDIEVEIIQDLRDEIIMHRDELRLLRSKVQSLRDVVGENDYIIVQEEILSDKNLVQKSKKYKGGRYEPFAPVSRKQIGRPNSIAQVQSNGVLDFVKCITRASRDMQ